MSAPAEHSFGGQRMDRYVFEFETDLGGDDGGGYEAAETALAETLAGPADEPAGLDGEALYDDALTSLEVANEIAALSDPEIDEAFGSELGEAEWAPSREEWEALQRQQQQQVFEYLSGRDLEQRQAGLAAAIRDANDPWSENFNPAAAEELAALLLAEGGGEIEQHGAADTEAEALAGLEARIDALTAAVAPDLPPSVVQERADQIFDEVAKLTGLSGDELVSASLQAAAELIRATGGARLASSELERFGAEEAFRVDQRLAAAAGEVDRLYGEFAPGANRAAVQQRVSELLEPLRESTGLSGVALAREALRLAAEDSTEVDTYDEALARMRGRVEAGLPVRRSGLGHVDAPPSLAQHLAFDSYDDVESFYKQQR